MKTTQLKPNKIKPVEHKLDDKPDREARPRKDHEANNETGKSRSFFVWHSILNGQVQNRALNS